MGIPVRTGHFLSAFLSPRPDQVATRKSFHEEAHPRRNDTITLSQTGPHLPQSHSEDGRGIDHREAFAVLRMKRQ
jgi:hypothetical protein